MSGSTFMACTVLVKRTWFVHTHKDLCAVDKPLENLATMTNWISIVRLMHIEASSRFRWSVGKHLPRSARAMTGMG